MKPSDAPPGRSIDASGLVGSRLADRFGVLRLVSEGANTLIYDAVDHQSGRTVTLKLVQPLLAASPSFRTRFDETMRAVAALSHPNIAAVYDWGIAPIGDTSTAYVVTELLTGGSLRDMFDRGRRLSPSQALVVGLEACRGLDHAHRRGFVHGELTPPKLVFGDDRRLRIVDFGLARLLGEPSWAQPDSVSSYVAWYASPEQGLGQPIDGKTDVYALCLVLHEAVTGTLPFRNDSTVASLTARVGRLMPVSADLGPLATVFERAGRPEREERSSAAQLGRDLVQAASKLPRPEPLPLLSSGLFDTPADQLRSPDDPTGGVVRPGAARGATPGDVVVVPLDEALPEAADEPPPVAPPTAAPPDEPGLVIQPLDSDVVAAEQPVVAAEQPVVVAAEQPVVVAAEPAAAPPVGAAPPGRVTQAMPAVAAPADQPGRRRRVPWKIVIGLLVVAALVALGVIASQLFTTPSYVVPDLRGRTEAEARNLVATNGWEITVQEERSDDVPVVGQVVRTVPEAGVELAEGEPFLIVTSEGPELRALPNSSGLPLADAQAQLNSLSLQVSVVEQPDELVPAGSVIAWSVPDDPTLTAGAEVLPQTLVELVVSTGPAPRTVPNLAGLPVADARATIEGMQLVLVEAEQAFSDDVPLGSVIGQDVAEGTQVPRGSTVTVVVSKGPDLVQFPDLTGVTVYDQAAQIVRDAGFEPRLALGDSQGQVAGYTIDGETPAPGATYRRGTPVDFVVLSP